MLAIRLQRIGKKKQPSYRLVVSEQSKDLYGDHLEILGHYNPAVRPKVISLKAERIKHWLSVGAKPSPTVHNLLVSQGVLSSPKVKAWQPKKKKTGTGAEAPKESPKEPPKKPASERTQETPQEKPAVRQLAEAS